MWIPHCGKVRSGAREWRDACEFGLEHSHLGAIAIGNCPARHHGDGRIHSAGSGARTATHLCFHIAQVLHNDVHTRQRCAPHLDRANGHLTTPPLTTTRQCLPYCGGIIGPVLHVLLGATVQTGDRCHRCPPNHNQATSTLLPQRMPPNQCPSA